MQIPEKKLFVLGLVIAGTLIASVIAPAVVSGQQQQNSSDLRFEYTKSGGIAGINERITFESAASYSGTNVIRFYKDLSVVEKLPSSTDIEAIKRAISDSRFFEMQGNYPPKQSGVADYFSYSLTITLNNQTHSVSWVDDFASSVPVPEGLGTIAKTIEDAYANASTSVQPLDSGRRRVTETVVKQSTPHDAQGHSSHQATYLLLANRGYLYTGTVTFTSDRPVDVLVYHDVTGKTETNLNGIGIHLVGGRSYAVTSLMKNVTSGSFTFVGSGVLMHTSGSDPFAVVATMDVLRKVSTVQSKLFTVDVGGEKFRVQATDSEAVQQLTDNYNGKNNMHVTGRLLPGDGGFNQPYSWHLDPASVRMAEVSVELCDGLPSTVQSDLQYWLGTVGFYCPWASRVTGIN